MQLTTIVSPITTNDREFRQTLLLSGVLRVATRIARSNGVTRGVAWQDS